MFSTISIELIYFFVCFCDVLCFEEYGFSVFLESMLNCVINLLDLNLLLNSDCCLIIFFRVNTFDIALELIDLELTWFLEL